MKLPKLKFKPIFYSVMGCFAGLGIIGFIARLYLKVKAGEGLDYYISGAGYKLNYIGALILFALLPIVMVGGWLIGKYLKWRDARMEKKLIEERLEKSTIKSKNET
jgi:hypothetical protein